MSTQIRQGNDALLTFILQDNRGEAIDLNQAQDLSVTLSKEGCICDIKAPFTITEAGALQIEFNAPEQQLGLYDLSVVGNFEDARFGDGLRAFRRDIKNAVQVVDASRDLDTDTPEAPSYTAQILLLAKGDKGEQGEPGAPGERGQDGAKGERGERGEKGDKGEPFTFADLTEEQKLQLKGERGERGEKGERGERGERGEPGIAGERGEDGRPGQDGTIDPEQRKKITSETKDLIKKGLYSIHNRARTYKTLIGYINQQKVIGNPNWQAHQNAFKFMQLTFKTLKDLREKGVGIGDIDNFDTSEYAQVLAPAFEKMSVGSVGWRWKDADGGRAAMHRMIKFLIGIGYTTEDYLIEHIYTNPTGEEALALAHSLQQEVQAIKEAQANSTSNSAGAGASNTEASTGASNNNAEAGAVAIPTGLDLVHKILEPFYLYQKALEFVREHYEKRYIEEETELQMASYLYARMLGVYNSFTFGTLDKGKETLRSFIQRTFRDIEDDTIDELADIINPYLPEQENLDLLSACIVNTLKNEQDIDIINQSRAEKEALFLHMLEPIQSTLIEGIRRWGARNDRPLSNSNILSLYRDLHELYPKSLDNRPASEEAFRAVVRSLVNKYAGKYSESAREDLERIILQLKPKDGYLEPSFFSGLLLTIANNNALNEGSYLSQRLIEHDDAYSHLLDKVTALEERASASGGGGNSGAGGASEDTINALWTEIHKLQKRVEDYEQRIARLEQRTH